MREILMKSKKISLLVLLLLSAVTTHTESESVQTIVTTTFSQGATALIAALKKNGHLDDAKALEDVKTLMLQNKIQELGKQVEDGSLKTRFSADMQKAVADKLPTSKLDIAKISALRKHLQK